MKKNKNSQRVAKFILGMLASVIFVSSVSIGRSIKDNNHNGQTELTTVDKLRQTIDLSIDPNTLNRDLVLDSQDREVSGETELTLIIELEGTPLLKTYRNAGYDNIVDYVKSKGGNAKANINLNHQKNLVNKLLRKNLIEEVVSNYSVLLNAVSVKAKYKNLSAIENFDGVKNVIVSTNYEKPKTLSGKASGPVYNDAHVADTGIYDASNVEYTGKGTAVAVLDTGADYTHSAFQVMPENPKISKEDVESVLEFSAAYALDSSIDVEDVYYSEKIPFGFDYADLDPNIYPLSEEHGTHVAGIIGGEDDVITGVATDAQLVIMKVFPDSEEGASTEGILQALEDCILLDVDVVNMSLGSTIGFSREVDDQYVNDLYDSFETEGIILDVAAGNEYSGGYGGDFSNTNYSYNPDSSVIGSPASYYSPMAVASINGILEPYIEANDGETIAFLVEAVKQNGDDWNFIEMLGLSKDGITEKELEYVTVPGYGLRVNYSAIDVEGKIALVKRGNNTFAEKIEFARDAGAAGILIYNNVTGDIKMSVGDNVGIPVASISKNAGDEMAKHPTGKIKASIANYAGPFMSDFSSWGPNPSLELKPEITAHGGNITSAVIGGDYDTISGTSMATPNLAGVSALMVEHLNETNPGLKGTEKLALINQVQMSTATVVMNQEGNPYSPRKQGAGLANLYSAINTKAYLSVDGSTKTKLELYDDPTRSGVYDMTFNLNNLSSESLSYKVVPYTMTESMSSDEKTVLEMAYMLSPNMEVTVEGNGSYDSSTKNVTVTPNGKLKINVKLTLSAEDKEYIDKTFENGMFVEGYIQLQSLEENENELDNIDLSIPFLAFYGDWGEAPIFDKDIFEVQSTEFDDSINDKDKIKADYYATTYYGKYGDFYIIPLGSYIYSMDESKYDMIPATQEKAAISYADDTINGMATAYVGMLRSAKTAHVKITDVSTGEVIYDVVLNNQRKAFYNGGSGSIVASMVPFDDFNIQELGLTNNSQYRLTIDAKLDYDSNGTNKKDSISFDFYIDTQAPNVLDSRFYKEYDKTEKKDRSYVEIDVYDNRFAQSVRLGTIENGAFNSLMDYPVPIYQNNANEVTTVKIEITDYLPKIYASDVTDNLVVIIDDYALNQNLFLLPMGETWNPDFKFTNGESTIDITLSPNQVFDIESLTGKTATFIEGLTWESSNESVALAKEGKIIALKEGNAVVTGKNLYQINYDAPTIEGGGKKYDLEKALKLNVNIKVLAEGEPGYVEYDKPLLDKIAITSSLTVKTFQSDYENTDLYQNDHLIYFDGAKALTVYPGEAFKLSYAVYPWTISQDRYQMVWKSSNTRVATVDNEGSVTAVGKGMANITLSIIIDGREYTQTDSLRVTVNDPFIVQGSVLMAYKGLGGEVVIPDDIGIKYIYPYAFPLYNYLAITDDGVIYEAIGNDAITKIVVPEGVEQIFEGAFANLVNLEEVVLPSTLTKIDKYAFRNNPNLVKVNLDSVVKIGNNAFENCPKLQLNDTTDLQKTATIGNFAFKNCVSLTSLDLSTVGYAGINTFEGCTNLANVTFSELTYLSRGMFKDSGVTSATILSDVIPTGIFEGASKLESVSFLNENVVINANAFANATSLTTVNFATNSNVSFADLSFANTPNLKNITLPNGEINFNGNVFYNSGLEKLTINENTIINSLNNAPFAETNSFNTIEVSVDSANYSSIQGMLFDKDNKLLLVPTNIGENLVLPKETAIIGTSALAGNKTIKSLTLEENSSLTKIESYAFANSNIEVVNLSDAGVVIEDYAFANCKNLVTVNNLDKAPSIGNGAFASTSINEVTIKENVVVGARAFADTSKLTVVNLNNNVTINEYAFENSNVTTLNINGTNVKLGAYSFKNNDQLVSVDLTNVTSVSDGVFKDCGRLLNVNLGTNITEIPDSMFEDCIAIKQIDFANIVKVGNYAFSGATALTTINNTSNVEEVGDYAFVNVQRLVKFDLSNVRVLGNFAFANAYSLTNINLSSVETLGEEVFNNCQGVTTVVLNENLTNLSKGLFFNCLSLKTINTENITVVDEYAFSNCSSLTFIELNLVVTVKEYAFYNSGLARVTLNSAETIEKYAFFGSKVRIIGIPKVVTIGDFAFASTSLIKDVTLPDTIKNLGKYVFADNIDLERFVFTQDGKKVDTGVLNDLIMLDEGVLYTKISDGYQVVHYPEAKKDITYTIVEGTTKVATYAFAFQKYLTTVELPYSLKYIADYAFLSELDANGGYNTKLTKFVFKSYKAPILEGIYVDPDEYEFEIDYYDANGNITNSMDNAVEAKISKRMEKMYEYAMFYDPYCYSNFIGYVGQVSGLTIEYPSNGIGYDGMIYNWFFDIKTTNGPVMSDVTMAAYNAIEALKDASEITLDDEAAVVEARRLVAYINPDDAEQFALLTNYDKLVAAEAVIKELKPIVIEEYTQMAFDAIEKLKDASEITLNDIYDVEEARAWYDLVTDPEQLAFLTNAEKLFAAEAKIAELKLLENLPENVKNVVSLINSLPSEITLEDADAIKEARKAYNALNEEEKAKVANYDKLVAAEQALDALNNADNSNGNGLIVGLAIGAIVVVAGCVLFVILKKKKETNQ